MHNRVILLCSFLLVSWSSFAQFEALEDSAFIYRSNTFRATTDSARLANNDNLYRLLLSALQDPKSYNYPFSKLKSLSVLSPPDGKFRVFTWNVQLDDFSHKLYGLVQTRFKRKQLPTVIELRTNDTLFTDWENTVTATSNWLGAVYYDIIPTVKGNDPVYVLLGWRGKDRMVSQKVVEVVHFKGDSLKLGAPLIQHGNSVKNRAVFNYPSSIVFSLKHHKDGNMIVFDRLAPMNHALAGNYAFYSPQFIFDAYLLKKKKWVLVQDVDVKLPERERRKPTPPPGQAAVPQR